MDQGRLNVARHGILMCVRRVLNEQNVIYSMPTFRSGSHISAPPGRLNDDGPGQNGNATHPSATPPNMGVQQAVGRASQAGWLPGQRGDNQIEGMAALLPDAIRQQL